MGIDDRDYKRRVIPLSLMVLTGKSHGQKRLPYPPDLQLVRRRLGHLHVINPAISQTQRVL